VHAAFDRGIVFFETADACAAGASGSVLGRDQAVVVTTARSSR
jgi:aryl-alcohol dehydrogenase-like predicted oxidoreductase